MDCIAPPGARLGCNRPHHVPGFEGAHRLFQRVAGVVHPGGDTGAGGDGHIGKLLQNGRLGFAADEVEADHLAGNRLDFARLKLLEDRAGAVGAEHDEQHGELLRLVQLAIFGGGFRIFGGGGHGLKNEKLKF